MYRLIISAEAGDEYLKILNKNPQLFYVDHQVVTQTSGGQVIAFQVVYLYSKEDALQKKVQFEAAAQRALEQVDASMGAVEKALVIHDYLAQNCAYDQEHYAAGTLPAVSYTAYGELVEGTAVCDGYSRAYAYLMEHELGIPCTIVISSAMNHSWNMIELDGKWYHVDVTWDDPVLDCIGRVRHDNFLLSDQAISQGSPDGPLEKGKNHYAWTKGKAADSDRYDGAFWTDVPSAICYYNGMWYYSRYNEAKGVVRLERKQDLFADGAETAYETTRWSEADQLLYKTSFMYLVRAGGKLYFNTKNILYR